jgi:hypothetical protein
LFAGCGIGTRTCGRSLSFLIFTHSDIDSLFTHSNVGSAI